MNKAIQLVGIEPTEAILKKMFEENLKLSSTEIVCICEIICGTKRCEVRSVLKFLVEIHVNRIKELDKFYIDALNAIAGCLKMKLSKSVPGHCMKTGVSENLQFFQGN